MSGARAHLHGGDFLGLVLNHPLERFRQLGNVRLGYAERELLERKVVFERLSPERDDASTQCGKSLRRVQTRAYRVRGHYDE